MYITTCSGSIHSSFKRSGGLVVKASAREREVMGSIPILKTKVFATGSSGFFPWRFGLLE